jgi:hypothetical protein
MPVPEKEDAAMWRKIRAILGRMLGVNVYPADPRERARIRALMLGAGAGPAMRPDPDGKIRITVE